MRVTYVARSFLDYRIPVFEELNRKLNGELYLVYSADYIPARVNARLKKALGDHAIGMTGEKRIGPNEFPDFSNTRFRFVYQPGLMKQIRETRPDVVIGDGFFQWTAFALVHKILHRTPLAICYERTFHTERNAQRLRTWYRKGVLKLIDAVACSGVLSREYTRWLGMQDSRITVGHMVADVDNLVKETAAVSSQVRNQLRTEWGNPDTVFLAVGKLNERKGISQLLKGWAHLEKNDAGRSALVLVGEGPDETKLREMAHNLGLKRVIFAGAVDYDRISQYYASVDAFVVPTLEDNWSLVVPEAMACGLPVLCSRYNGCYPELIEEGSNGWVFDPHDEQDIFRVLNETLKNRDTLTDMGQRSQQIVALHRPEHAADAILRTCEIACHGPG